MMNPLPENCLDCNARSVPSTPNYFGSIQGMEGSFRPLLSEEASYNSVFGLSCTLIMTCSFGIASNILVLKTFLKIGFSDSINISYFALGMSDVGVLVTTSWGAICNLFDLAEVKLPFHAMEISSPTMFWPSEAFEKTTTCITAYIALERCLCVLFPLHVKRIVTRKNTGIVIVAIFVLVFLPSLLGSLGYSFVWEFDSLSNTTIMRTIITRDPNLQLIEYIIKTYVCSVIHYTAMVIIWICTAFLSASLRRNVKSREATFGQRSSDSGQIRNMRVIKTVLLIAVAYMCFSTPKSAAVIVNAYLEPEFNIRGKLSRLYMTTIIICVQFSIFNSSINLFVYVFMSTKFRETLHNFLFSNYSNTKG